MDEVLNVEATKQMAMEALTPNEEDEPQGKTDALVSAFNGGPEDEVTRVLDEMPAQERQVLRGRYVAKHSVQQVAGQTGMTAEGVEALSSKALLKFAKGYHSGRYMVYNEAQE